MNRTPEKRILVSAAVIRRQQTLLIARRSPGQRFAGKWEFPGGKLEENESIEDCLVREIKEELNLDVTIIMELPRSQHAGSSGTIELVPFLCDATDYDIRLHVHDSIEWVRPDELLSFELMPADIPIARDITRRQDSLFNL